MNRIVFSFIIGLAVLILIISSTTVNLHSKPTRITVESATNNGDIVVNHGKVYNLSKLDNFIEDVRIGNTSKIQIIQFTIEGDPIVQKLEFDNNTIKYSIDTSEDRYGGNYNLVIEATQLTKVDSENVFDYFLIDSAGNKTNILTASKY